MGMAIRIDALGPEDTWWYRLNRVTFYIGHVVNQRVELEKYIQRIILDQ